MIESPGRGPAPHFPWPDPRPDDADRLRRIYVPDEPGPERDRALELVARKQAAQQRLASERAELADARQQEHRNRITARDADRAERNRALGRH